MTKQQLTEIEAQLPKTVPLLGASILEIKTIENSGIGQIRVTFNILDAMTSFAAGEKQGKGGTKVYPEPPIPTLETISGLLLGELNAVLNAVGLKPVTTTTNANSNA